MNNRLQTPANDKLSRHDRVQCCSVFKKLRCVYTLSIRLKWIAMRALYTHREMECGYTHLFLEFVSIQIDYGYLLVCGDVARATQLTLLADVFQV